MPYSPFYFAFATIRVSSQPESESKTMLTVLLIATVTLAVVFCFTRLIATFGD